MIKRTLIIAEAGVTVFFSNHADRSLYEAMDHAVVSIHGGGFLYTPLYREFAQLDQICHLPDERTILRFDQSPSPRRKLEKHNLPSKSCVR